MRDVINADMLITGHRQELQREKFTITGAWVPTTTDTKMEPYAIVSPFGKIIWMQLYGTKR